MLTLLIRSIFIGVFSVEQWVETITEENLGNSTVEKSVGFYASLSLYR